MGKKNLCCNVNPDKQCKHCLKMFCAEHTFSSSTWSTPMTYFCHACYDKVERKPFYTAKKKGLSFKAFYRKARKIAPKGYMSLQVELQESNPGSNPPSLIWSIYCSADSGLAAGSVKGDTPEAALLQLQAKVEKEYPSLENVNV